MSSGLNREIRSAIQHIALRTERQDPKTVLDSFYDCNIIEHLKNINHQIIQGRRGTGKTHILHVLQNDLECKKVHCIFFDCKATGSAGEIANEQIPTNHRAIQLMRDFLFNLHADLIEYFKDSLCTHPNREEIELLLDHLHKECFSYEETTNSYEKSKTAGTKAVYSDESSGEISFSPTLAFKLFNRNQKERGMNSSQKESGTKYRKVVFPNIYKCINDLSEITGIDWVFLIDEWSNLPLTVQPHFAEFLRCCFMPSSHITVKIAAVEARTKYFIKRDNEIYGLEVGADINVAMDLDRLYMFDRNPRKISVDLYRILLRHLKTKNVFEDDIDVSELLKILFEDAHTPILLARAAEGNPRDFISIINHCIIEMNVIGEQDDRITSPIVFQAANSWYNLDKHKALDATQKRLLSEITTFVVQKKQNRGFVIDEDYLYSSSISSLVDARVLHVLQTERKFSNFGKGPMAIVVLDFGTYSQELWAHQSIHFLINDFYEKEIFGKGERTYCVSPIHQLDKDRKFQLCFLDPKSPNICPSFTE